jgi:hypothetical protein
LTEEENRIFKAKYAMEIINKLLKKDFEKWINSEKV